LISNCCKSQESGYKKNSATHLIKDLMQLCDLTLKSK